MDFPIQSPTQLASHLRALRKVSGLSQAQLGAALGVGQTRIARIERNPTAVSVAQFLEVLRALGAQMVLREQPAQTTTATRAAPSKPKAGGAAAKRRPTSDAW